MIFGERGVVALGSRNRSKGLWGEEFDILFYSQVLIILHGSLLLFVILVVVRSLESELLCEFAVAALVLHPDQAAAAGMRLFLAQLKRMLHAQMELPLTNMKKRIP